MAFEATDTPASYVLGAFTPVPTFPLGYWIPPAVFPLVWQMNANFVWIFSAKKDRSMRQAYKV